MIAHFKKTVEELQEKDVENEDTKAVIVNFPSSLTPFRTYTQHLIHNHPKLLSDRSYRVLSTDFSSHSIRYLVDPAWYVFHLDNFGFISRNSINRPLANLSGPLP